MASGAEDGEAAGKASSIMPLDASKADHPVVLFKVPEVLRDLLTQPTEQEVSLGSLEVTTVGGRKRGNIVLHEACVAEDAKAFTPLRYSVSYMPPQGHRVLELTDTSALAIGLATENATLIPDAKDPRYSQYLKRRRTQASSQEQTKHRTRQLLAKDRRAVDEAVLSQPIGAMSSAAQRVNAAHMHSLAPGVNSEELAARRESAAVLDLFEVQAYWRVAVAMEFLPVGMNEKTVKETMAQHGTYHTSGKYRGCYSLREEFQSVKAKAVLQATAEADAALEAAAAAEGTASGR